MSAGPELVLLTSAYPFGCEGEPFLEAEIDVIARRFHRIYLLPSHRDKGPHRTLPANVELVEMDWLDEPALGDRKRALLSPDAAKALLWTLRAPSDLWSHVASRLYLDILSRNLLKLPSLKRFVVERGLGGAIFYDYWFENSTLALSLLRRSGAIRTAVSRAHGFDVYEERWGGRPVPFREAKSRSLDAVFAVSTAGAAYLEQRVRGLRGKVRVARLGVCDPGRESPRPAGTPSLVVTCGSLIPIKRVHLVPEVLRRLRRPVRWVHLGDGPERPRVEEATSHLGGNATGTLLGHLPNSEVRRFYASNPVSVFLSLSVSEGLPVSMMEAQSYGIPIVACGVGGVPEIVNDETGVLLSVDATPTEIATGLEEALAPGRFVAATLRSFFVGRFEATTNYNTFADALIGLHKRGSRTP